MKKFMLLLAMMLMTSSAYAGTCYLKNGDAIECERIWKKNGSVYIQVNRDTVLEFDAKEVDLQRSAVAHKKGKAKVKRKNGAPSQANAEKKPAVATAKKPAVATVAPKVPAEGEHAAAEPAMTASFTGLRQGCAAGNLDEVKKYMAAHHREAVEKMQREVKDPKELALRKKVMAELVPQGYTIVGSRVSRDGRKGMLRLKNGGSTGFVTLVKEGNGWKVFQSFWGKSGSTVYPPDLD